MNSSFENQILIPRSNNCYPHASDALSLLTIQRA
jgi:hypothetical protein